MAQSRSTRPSRNSPRGTRAAEPSTQARTTGRSTGEWAVRTAMWSSGVLTLVAATPRREHSTTNAPVRQGCVTMIDIWAAESVRRASPPAMSRAMRSAGSGVVASAPSNAGWVARAGSTLTALPGPQRSPSGDGGGRAGPRRPRRASLSPIDGSPALFHLVKGGSQLGRLQLGRLNAGRRVLPREPVQHGNDPVVERCLVGRRERLEVGRRAGVGVAGTLERTDETVRDLLAAGHVRCAGGDELHACRLGGGLRAGEQLKQA